MPPLRPRTMRRPASSATGDGAAGSIASAPRRRSDERVEQRLGLGALPVELADDDVHRLAVAADDHRAREDARRPGDGRVAVAVEQDGRLERSLLEKGADDL